MGRTSANIAAAITATSLTSCSPPEIRLSIVTDGGRYAIKLDQPWGFPFRRYEAPCVKSLIVSRGSGSFDDWRHPLWKIFVPGDVQCRKLGRVVLGEVPKGFVQLNALPTNLRGTYYLVVDGIGYGKLRVALNALPPVRYSVQEI